MPKISVVLSAYNAEKYIEKSVKSVLNQTFKDFEFLIIEDSSSDNTLTILREFAKLDSRIVLIEKEKNQGFIGYVQNLNHMISLAKGKYIAKFDADDIWLEDKLEKQLNDIENNKDIFLLSANAVEINEEDKEIGKVIRPHTEEESYKMILRENPFCHPSILFRNEGYTYREKMFYTEEYDLYLRMFSDGKKLVHRADFLFKYRILQNSLTRGNKAVIKALFKNKAISLYYERKQTGKDSYESFNPDDYLKIYDLDYNSTLNDLKQALKLSFTAGLKKDFQILIKKANNQYPKKTFFKYWIISKKFDLAYKIYLRK